MKALFSMVELPFSVFYTVARVPDWITSEFHFSLFVSGTLKWELWLCAARTKGDIEWKQLRGESRGGPEEPVSGYVSEITKMWSHDQRKCYEKVENKGKWRWFGYTRCSSGLSHKHKPLVLQVRICITATYLLTFLNVQFIFDFILRIKSNISQQCAVLIVNHPPVTNDDVVLLKWPKTSGTAHVGPRLNSNEDF